MTKQFYSGTSAVIYVYDVTNDRSLYDADVWLKDLEIYLTQDLHNGIPILFIGNKADKIPAGHSGTATLTHGSHHGTASKEKGSTNKMR